MYIRVVRKEGPQLSLIDLPGVTHNADQMENIHEVTVNLVEEYIKPEQMVILCVIPAMSDFGNAEVVKLARKYDPDGFRTLGVITKCDDAANAEASDIVEKVLMKRSSDVQLELGFHCVVNRSQKNIDEGMSREDLWAKEKSIFTKNDRMKRLPGKNWGTLQLMEKVAKIQEARVDECLPKIKGDVRKTISELQADLRALPVQPETETDRLKLFNSIVSQIRDDLARRIRAEFMSADSLDREVTIAPKVASIVAKFKAELLRQNPDWLEQSMIDEVDDTVQHFVTGYTVDNLTGPQVFISLFKETFIEEGLLKESVHELVTDVGEQLVKVVHHVIEVHANTHGCLSNRLEEHADECIDRLTDKARDVCDMLAEAQQVTSTTHGQYAQKLVDFQKSLTQKGDNLAGTLTRVLGGTADAATGAGEVPQEFLIAVEQSQEDPRKLATLQTCASLHIYTGLMIDGFVEHSAKLVKFNMVEQLANKLEEVWREELGSDLQKLFPNDEDLVNRRKNLEATIKELLDFKEKLTNLRTAVPVQRRRNTRTLAERAKAREAKVPHVKPGTRFVWEFGKEHGECTLSLGEKVESRKFTQLGLQVVLERTSNVGWGLYLHGPKGWQIDYTATCTLRHGGTINKWKELATLDSRPGREWQDHRHSDIYKVEIEVHEAIPPSSKA